MVTEFDGASNGDRVRCVRITAFHKPSTLCDFEERRNALRNLLSAAAVALESHPQNNLPAHSIRNVSAPTGNLFLVRLCLSLALLFDQGIQSPYGDHSIIAPQ